jgi:MHS family proline/betaine transporter-like MFS transporter
MGLAGDVLRRAGGLPAQLLLFRATEESPLWRSTAAAPALALPALVLVMAGYGPDGIGPLLGYGPLLTVCTNASYAAVPIFLNEAFPTRLRVTATAVVWNGGFAIGGLMTTFVSLASPTVADIPGRLAVFLAGCVVLFLGGAALSRETRGALEREPVAA